MVPGPFGPNWTLGCSGPGLARPYSRGNGHVPGPGTMGISLVQGHAHCPWSMDVPGLGPNSPGSNWARTAQGLIGPERPRVQHGPSGPGSNWARMAQGPIGPEGPSGQFGPNGSGMLGTKSSSSSILVSPSAGRANCWLWLELVKPWCQLLAWVVQDPLLDAGLFEAWCLAPVGSRL